jgi:hypothetical protein
MQKKISLLINVLANELTLQYFLEYASKVTNIDTDAKRRINSLALNCVNLHFCNK